MLSSLFVPALFFLGALAAPLVEVDACATFPSWTITNFTSNAPDTVGSGGKASFKLTNNLTGASDELSCPLQVNYRCIISGIPSDKDTTVHIAVRAQSLTLLVDKAVECPGRTTPLHIVADSDINLKCTWEEGTHGDVACALEEEANTVHGNPVEFAAVQQSGGN